MNKIREWIENRRDWKEIKQIKKQIKLQTREDARELIVNQFGIPQSLDSRIMYMEFKE